MSMYEIRGFDAAQRQRDREVPGNYNLTALFKCEVCGMDIYSGEGYLIIGTSCYCDECVHEYIRSACEDEEERRCEQ